MVSLRLCVCGHVCVLACVYRGSLEPLLHALFAVLECYKRISAVGRPPRVQPIAGYESTRNFIMKYRSLRTPAAARARRELPRCGTALHHYRL
ncbi:hypothetical protein EVAR_14043_1 [Eumeta japonica]|uniref:Uncharacterized protein n=1 Tax=Eumeta variegata TaxID=151549 RepID=A0A4C1UN62_EUMVA|nr:hypothetical protein EVAR_14043_1 [Eumeta japonica]